MLSAFAARPLVELRQRDKFKIESVLVCGDRLLTGLSTGVLRIYRVNEDASSPAAGSGEGSSRPSTANAKAADLLREQEKFSKSAIVQLAAIKRANILVSLSNYQVSFHNLSTYELQETLAKTRGATTFAVNGDVVRDESAPALLAVAVKKKLIIWEWKDGVAASEQREFNLPATIRSVTWISGSKAVLGMTTYFILLSIESGKLTEISGPGSIGSPSTQESSRFSSVGVGSLMGGLGPMPMSTRLLHGEALLAKDINTHFINTDGRALGRRQIPWHQAPDALGYSYPYLLALNTAKGLIEVRNPETLTVLQTINLPNAKNVYVSEPIAGVESTGKAFIASERGVWRLRALDYDAQIDVLVKSSLWDEALSLLRLLEDNLLSDKTARLDEVTMLKAEDLFKSRHFRQSLELFIDVKAPPRRVIRLFPHAISGDTTPDNVSLVSDKLGDNGDNKSINEDAKSETSKAETSSIIGSLRAAQWRLSKGDQSGSTKDGKSSKEDSAPGRDDSFSEKELKDAVIELISFLVDTRTRIQRVLDFDGRLKDATDFSSLSDENKALVRRLEDSHELAETIDDRVVLHLLRETARLVDSTLFRCYMLARPQLAGPLFRLPNFIDAEVAEEKLLESKRYSDLVDFFYGKGLHERALGILTSLGKGETEDEDVPESLRGPQRIVTYLQTLSGDAIDLILRFADWPMHADADLAMEVFTGDGSNAEHLPRKRVLDYLQSFSPVRAAEYLEFIISEFDDKQTDIHYRLIELYLLSLEAANMTAEERQSQQRKLLEFVRSSRSYEPWRVVPLLRKDDPNLHEPRAVVLGRMGQHKQALEIYVFDMNDIPKAEAYCNEVWLEQQQQQATSTSAGEFSRPRSSGAEGDRPTPYLNLLSLLLSPRAPRKPQLGPALDLLARHGARLPAASTLGLIPEDIPVADVEAYFKARMRASTATASLARITAGLRKTVDDNSDAALRLGDEEGAGVPGAGKGRNRSVMIWEERICKVCRKRFGGSAIKVLPGGEEVVHYGCATR